MFNTDREFIENKYHKTNENFDPFERMAYHGYDFDKSTGLEDEEINDGLAKLYEKTRGLPHPVAKAHAVKYVLENTKIDINEHDYFVGFWSVNRLANCVTSNKWNEEVFDNILPELKEKMHDTECVRGNYNMAGFRSRCSRLGFNSRFRFSGTKKACRGIQGAAQKEQHAYTGNRSIF